MADDLVHGAHSGVPADTDIRSLDRVAVARAPCAVADRGCSGVGMSEPGLAAAVASVAAMDGALLSLSCSSVCMACAVGAISISTEVARPTAWRDRRNDGAR